ncbi:serine/threonine protein kinase [Nocardioides sp.]|uniref:YncE family protein n=1 Tax=Nocardioides sp. TaxID=35761 RepID=UPI002B265DC3|nr:serine/threonine protein kinase [Nocardioides sp.]
MGRNRFRAGLRAGLTGVLTAGVVAGLGGFAPGAGAAQASYDGAARGSLVVSSPGPVGDPERGTRRVVFVGNNWDGTADVVAPGSFERLGRLDVVPDYDERMQEIAANPYRLAYFLAIRTAIGEGNDQFVDDMYSSNDGRLVVISRPSFADVVAISLKTKKIVWRFEVDGVRSDHMAVSPDGKRVVVSASTGNVVHVLRIKDGAEVGTFPSGGSPHESVFLDGGKRILHASIGTVYSPLDDPDVPDPLEGERVLQIVNARTLKVKRRYDVRQALDDAGLEKVSISVRPLTLSPDEKKIYFQLSFFHGFVELDRRTGEITRFKRLPNLVKSTPRPAYVLDSAHHGIAMNPKGTRLCVAGTMSDYATIVRAKSFKRTRLLKGGEKPYWVTPSADGKYCYISWSGTDTISRISYRRARIVDTIDVGNHPQRIRNGFIRKGFVEDLGEADPRMPAGTTG